MDKSQQAQTGAEHIKSKINSLSLRAAMVLAVIVTLLLSILSYWLYLSNPNYKYDLARPDVKRTVNINDTQDVAEDSKPVDLETLENAQDSVKEYLNDVDSLDDFGAKPLTDRSLSLNN